MRILAVDPGGVSGVAWYNMQSHEMCSTEIENGRFGMYDFLRPTDLPHYDAVVCENYIITSQTAKKSHQVDALHIIGYLEGICYQQSTALILQTPSQAKGFATNAKLKFLDWRNPSKGGHRDDAARHLLTYLVRTDPWMIERMQEFAVELG